MAKGKVNVKETYDALPPEKQAQVDVLLTKLAEPDPTPMATADLTAAYEALSLDAQMEVSRVMDRLAERANDKVAREAARTERQAARQARQ